MTDPTGGGPAPGQVSVVLAAGGTAGHLEPALALADALRRAAPDVAVTVLGTTRGLEARLVPARGYRLVTIPAVPLPRRPDRSLATVLPRLAGAVRAAGRALGEARADVVVGFGSYAALPAYVAARRARIPVVVHESNPLPGLGNKVGARLTHHVHTAVPGTPLPHATVTGIPLRRSITTLDRVAGRAGARAFFGLDPDRPVLLVTGGSQGASRLNTAAAGAAARLSAAGFGVLHVTGAAAAGLDDDGPPGGRADIGDTADTADIAVGVVAVGVVDQPAGVVRVDYVDRMDLAYAAADLVLCRAGSTTCAEVSAVGLPAVFVPLPHGNGEQAANAAPLVRAGAALLVPDAELTADTVAGLVGGLLGDPERLGAMAAAGRDAGHADADDRLAAEVLRIAAGAGAGAGTRTRAVPRA